MISKAKLARDASEKERKGVPGVGKYKETERGYRALSKPPTSLKRRR